MGELLRVLQLKVTTDTNTSLHFHIYKLNFTTKDWEEVDCLPGRALYLSDRGQPAMSLSTSNFPDLDDNSIYFTYNRNRYDPTFDFLPNMIRESDRDAGVTDDLGLVVYNNLENRTIKSYYKSRVNWSTTHDLFWIAP